MITIATADTVFVNGKVATVDKQFSFHKAIAVKNGWIIDVGQNSQITEYIGAGTNVIDLKGKVILPAAHDAHVHGVTNAMTTILCDCSPAVVKNVGDLQSQLAKEVKKARPGAWIKGHSIHLDSFEECINNPGQRISRKDIDNATPDNPVFITFSSMHGAMVNSKALEVCGINRDTPDPATGVMVRDGNGDPTGLFYEFEAIDIVRQHVPHSTAAELKEGIIAFQKKMNKDGYAGYTESTIGLDPGTEGPLCLEVYKDLFDAGQLTNRVTIGIITTTKGVATHAAMLNALDNYKPPEYPDPDWLKASMMKIFCDGVHTNHTAWMFEDYADRPGFHGTCSIPGDTEDEQEAELHKMIALAHQRGFQVGIHADGERAVKASIEGFIKAMQSYPRKNPRHYIIHAFLATNDLAKRAAKFGIPFSVQPGMADHIYEASVANLGPRGKRVFGLREFIDYGVVCAGGSDIMHGDLCHWRQAVQSAITRRSSITGEVYSPELAISLEEGIRLFTNNCAYQENCEAIRGSIEIGKVADFQVLEEDIFQIDPEEIGKIQVDMTMVGGKIVYSK